VAVKWLNEQVFVISNIRLFFKKLKILFVRKNAASKQSEVLHSPHPVTHQDDAPLNQSTGGA
jgi:hypothetical protein